MRCKEAAVPTSRKALQLQVVFLVLVILACGPEQKPDISTPVEQDVDFSRLGIVERELKEWGEGRWKSVEVYYHRDEERPILWEITVVDSPDANTIALKSYCRIAREEMQRALPGILWTAEIRQRGRLLRTCQ